MISRSRLLKRKHTESLPQLDLQQAKDYAEILGFKFAYATNGREIIEFDYLTGQQRDLDRFPYAPRAVGAPERCRAN